MDFELDPREVLQHLNALGYYNISRDQLREFIKDLKKLIKYDLKKKKIEVNVIRSDDSAPSNRSFSSCSIESNRESIDDKENRPQMTSETTDELSRPCSRSCGQKAGKDSQRAFRLENKQGSTKSIISDYNSGKGDDFKKQVRSCASFIRPGSSTSRQGKSDPVSLYHHYQSLWAQQNLPGDNPHTDLRWRIRHKMMGHNPSKIDDKKVKTPLEHPPWVDP